MKVLALHLVLATVVVHCSSIRDKRYDWFQDGVGDVTAGSDAVFRALTADPSYPSDAVTTARDTSVPTSIDYAPAATDDDVGSAGIPLALSKASINLLREILGAKVSTDDGLALDIVVTSSDDDDDDDDRSLPSSSQPTDAASVIADILDKGTTTPGTSEISSAVVTGLDQAYQKFSSAARAFSQAQDEARNAEQALESAQASVSSAGGEAVAKAVVTSREDAVDIITRARAEARAKVLAARRDYVSAVAKAHAKITVLKLVEKRFRALAVTFAKARLYASSAIAALKGSSQKGASYATALATAKSRVAKMKIVEKRFIAMAKAYANARREAIRLVKAVRKAAFAMAQVFASSTAKVSAAVELATASVSKALTVAKATSIAKAIATVNAVEDDRDEAYEELRVAAVALAESRSNLEAIVASHGAASVTGSALAGGDSAGASGEDTASQTSYGDSPTRLSSTYSRVDDKAAASVALTTGSNTDKTDTMASY